MNYEALLPSLKVDLSISRATVYDDRLLAILKSSGETITNMGITLDPESLRDQQLVIMHAAWTWRKRDSMESMPRMLQYELHSRLAMGKMHG